MGWLREARDEAQLYLDNQPGYDKLEEDRRIVDRHYPDLFSGIVMGRPAMGAGAGMGSIGNASGGRIHIPMVKQMLSELTAILGNIEPSWSYDPQNENLRSIADILDLCKQTWWERTSAVEAIVRCLQWSAVNRTGYIFPKWNPSFHGRPQRDVQNGDIELVVGGPEDYLPLWLDSSKHIQKAYAGTIREKMPITQFAAMWPTLAASVYPDNEQPGMLRRAANTVASYWSADRGNEEKAKPGSVPLVTVYWTYINDGSMNLTRNTIPMGDSRTNTYYEVPAFGSEIPTGLINVNTGNDLMRKAEEIDTYLYPWLRLVIWTDDVICYDGPSYWFHGKIPAVKLTLDPWPWSFLGGSLVRDIVSLEEANNRLVKSIDHREQMRSDPSRAVNEDLLDNTTIDDIRRQVNTPGGLVKVSRFTENLLKPLSDPRDNQVDQWELKYGEMNTNAAMDILGLNNLQRLSEMRGGQIPGGDTQEKMLQITGARTERKGKLMEDFCRELAPMIGGLILQKYDTHLRHMLFGYKGIAKYDFDFDPGSLVPAELPDRPGLPGDRKFGDFRSGMFDTRAKRAKYLIAMMGTSIEKGSLLDITSMTRQLIELKLYADPTCPKDPMTLFTALKMNGIGTMDDDEDKDSRMGRAKKWRRVQMEESLEEQRQMAEIQQGATPEGKTANALRDMVDHAVGQSNGGAVRAQGRPSVFSESPQLRKMNRPDGTQDVIIDTSSNR